MSILNPANVNPSLIAFTGTPANLPQWRICGFGRTASIFSLTSVEAWSKYPPLTPELKPHCCHRHHASSTNQHSGIARFSGPNILEKQFGGLHWVLRDAVRGIVVEFQDGQLMIYEARVAPTRQWYAVMALGMCLTDKFLHVFGVLLRDKFEKHVHQLEPTLRPGFQD